MKYMRFKNGEYNKLQGDASMYLFSNLIFVTFYILFIQHCIWWGKRKLLGVLTF